MSMVIFCPEEVSPERKQVLGSSLSSLPLAVPDPPRGKGVVIVYHKIFA